MDSLLIVGEIGLYREALAIALSHREEFDRIETARDVSAALQILRSGAPDVILLDLDIKNALPTLRSLARNAGPAVVVALTVPNGEGDIIACATAGASAYVTRDGSIDDLLSTILAAMRGDLHCSARIAGALFRRLSSVEADTAVRDRHLVLSQREMQVLHLIEEGHSNKEISNSLCIEVATVKNHVHHILEKLKVRRRGEAAAFLRRMN